MSKSELKDDLRKAVRCTVDMVAIMIAIFCVIAVTTCCCWLLGILCVVLFGGAL